MNFEDRKERLSEITKSMDLEINLPMLHGGVVKEPFLNKLKQSVSIYIYSTLCEAYPDRTFHLSNHIIDDYENEIRNLPNITPNGLVLPKQETWMAYHEIHKSVASMMSFYSLGNMIEKVHNPINIRFVQGGCSADVEKRPKASSKLHTDIWAGEFSQSIMIFLTLFGDIENLNVEFFEPPQEFYPEFVKPLNSYDEGAHFIHSSKSYNEKLKQDSIYFIDSFLLHRTSKKSSKWRLSLDFRFLPKKIVPTDVIIETQRDENYIAFDDWVKFGYDRYLYSDKKIDEFTERGNNVYASEYKMLNCH